MHAQSWSAVGRWCGRILVLSMLAVVARPVLADSPGGSNTDVGLRIRFGLEDKSPSKWDGSVSVSPGRVTYLSGWRFIDGDKVNGTEGWTASTHATAQQGRGNNAKKAAANAAKRAEGAPVPTSDNGVLVSLADVTADSRVTVKTEQGEFAFALSEVPYGALLTQLDGAVEVERIGTAQRLTTARTDDDYPAAAVAPDGTKYVAYVSYTPGGNRDEYNKVELKGKQGNFIGRNWEREPEDMSFLSRQPGGDRLWLRVARDGKWSEPIAVTDGGGDIYKCGLAIDGSGQAWVTWSQNVRWPEESSATEGPRPNFEIFVRPYAGDKLGEAVNLSNNAANDVNPAITADSQGRVWLAWQAVRDGVFGIVERHQAAEGKWSPERRVSAQARSCWTPAAAAAADGRVAIAWDTYDKGDYDVWLREFGSDGSPHEPQPVANSIDYEARPALTYDAQGALWIAYELGSPTWGKNFGEYIQKQGMPLYRGRQIGLIVRKDGKWSEPAGNYLTSLPGVKKRKKVVNQRVQAIEPQGESIQQARNAEMLRDLAYNNLARIVADGAGHIWLFCRSRQNDIRFPVLGSLWLSWATYYDGKSWTGPILLPNSDNLMYNTPATAALPGGGVLIAHSTDHRQERFPVRAAQTQPGPEEAWSVPGDPFDNDVYVSYLAAPSESAQALRTPEALRPAHYPPHEHKAPVQATVDELAAVERCRSQKVEFQGKTLHLVRGEFHRHTEISGDGGNDGPLEDMWRYAMDVASMDWLGCGDHDNGAGREYTWWLTQKTTDAFRIAGRFEPPYSYERSVSYPEGHRNVVFPRRGIRTLPRLPITSRDYDQHAPDTQMLYHYLKHFGGVCAAHTSATGMGTDWRDNDPLVEPFVEIYQGDRQNYERPGAPRCPTADYAVGGWEPKGFVNLALLKGYRLAFECSSDHISTHISYANVYAENNSPPALVEAMKQRHVYGSTDNIVADFRCTADGVEHMLGDEFTATKAPELRLKLVGTAPFTRLTLVKDDVEIPLTTDQKPEVNLTWTDPSPAPGKTSYYYVRGEQADGELVWVSPMWIKFQPTGTASR